MFYDLFHAECKIWLTPEYVVTLSWAWFLDKMLSKIIIKNPDFLSYNNFWDKSWKFYPIILKVYFDYYQHRKHQKICMIFLEQYNVLEICLHMNIYHSLFYLSCSYILYWQIISMLRLFQD